ncbi:hypothetical protein ANCCEY_12596 [Ancylostoma ceylanicum]|uniref:Uncharacterized protein n=2 Tax=Ancylostoma ceylanicum TaxID=53326 RepID=A0A0D6L9E0_9BILA|nr:hypothetical protein ANCCEY_12596 [Ancylostoma ceylanicum]EYC45932.1 hypothetical protein Y032_0413g1018 [Ancylostoma ceylanicum]
MEFDLDLTLRQVEADPYQTTHELAVALRENQSTIVRGLEPIVKARKFGRWVLWCSMTWTTALIGHARLEYLIIGDEK